MDKQLQVRVHFAYVQLVLICLGNTSNIVREIRSFWVSHLLGRNWVILFLIVQVRLILPGPLLHFTYVDLYLGTLFNMDVSRVEYGHLQGI